MLRNEALHRKTVLTLLQQLFILNLITLLTQTSGKVHNALGTYPVCAGISIVNVFFGIEIKQQPKSILQLTTPLRTSRGLRWIRGRHQTAIRS